MLSTSLELGGNAPSIVTPDADLADAVGAVLRAVPATATIVTYEIFGPVAPIVTRTDTDQLIETVNDTEFGLAAYVCAGDVGAGLRLRQRTEAGLVGINRGIISDPAAPFGGLKQSGLGREGALEGLHAYRKTQYFSAAWN